MCVGGAAAAGCAAADVGADVATPAALGADVGADVAAPTLAAADAGELVTAATVPDLSADAGLAAANATFGTFDPATIGLSGAETTFGTFDPATIGLSDAEDVFGTDIGAETADGNFFGGSSGNLFSGAGMGAGQMGTSFTGQPFGDVFSGAQAGVPGSDVGTFGGGQAASTAGTGGSWAGYAPGVGETAPTAPQAFGAATQDTGPIVSSDTGVVDMSGPTLQNTMATPSSVTPASQDLAGSMTQASINTGTASAPIGPDTTSLAGTNPIASDFANFPNAAVANPPSALGGQFANPSDLAMTGNIASTPASFSAPAFGGGELAGEGGGGLVMGEPTAGAGELGPDFVSGAQIQPLQTSLDTGAFTGAPSTAFGTTPSNILGTGAFDPTLSAGGISPSIVAGAEGGALTPLGAPAATAAAPFSGAPTAVTAAPGAGASVPAAAAPAATAATPAAAAAAPAAAGVAGTGLTGFQAGMLGLGAVNTGLNIYNALNQPSYPALQPIAYPGSPYAASPSSVPYPENVPTGVSGPGGIGGGLAASRLANGLVAGQSPQQLAQQGIISPARATALQSTYSGITQQYAQELGVSPQSLSPAVQQMIAAQAIADNGLGGR